MRTSYFKVLTVALVPVLFACNSTSNDKANADSTSADSMNVSDASYVNLSTGEPVTVIKDTETGHYVYSDTKKPVERDFIFVDVNSRDTLYGSTGVVVNNALIHTDAGTWSLNDDMIERDGEEIKVKTADGKLKVDGDEMKYKEGDDKVKVDGDKSKTKIGDTKIKTEDGVTKVKVDD